VRPVRHGLRAGRTHIEPEQQSRLPFGQHAPAWARAASSLRAGESARSASRTMHDERVRIDIGAVNIPPPSCRAYGPGRWRALTWIFR
jgi:hypothetical protein